MNMTVWQSIIMIIAVMLGTMLTRFLPFIIFPDNKTPPKYIQFLGKFLPYSVIGLLLVYCQKDLSLTQEPYGIPEVISIICIIIIHSWKRNMLLSIVTGTIIYILLTRFVFI